jgi:hypothetical protein
MVLGGWGQFGWKSWAIVMSDSGAKPIAFNMTFGDFQMLQTHMTRRTFARNRAAVGPALLGVVVCAVLITMAIVVNIKPNYRGTWFGFSYPLSQYVLLIMLLSLASVALIPAVRLRLKTLRMQVSDKNPLLGPTSVTVEPDGLLVQKELITTKYRWAAFKSAEIVKGAIILPVDTGMGVILPASAFANDAERFDLAASIAKQIEQMNARAESRPN